MDDWWSFYRGAMVKACEIAKSIAKPFQLSRLIIKAFKWGAVCTFTSNGKGNMESQIENFEINLIKNKLSTLTCHMSLTANWGVGKYILYLI